MQYSMISAKILTKISTGAMATACAALACVFVTVATPAQATHISAQPHVMAADNMAAWRNAAPTTCKGVRFGQIGKSDSPRYIFQNEGIESNNAGKEELCIPITAGGVPDNTRGVIVSQDSEDWKNAQPTECDDVRFRRKDGDTVFWVFGSQAAVYNDLSLCLALGAIGQTK